ncbi:unnamed protein product [Dovyalis caffra]|uniref:Uncharacterized protein n=1 Tax=Dovyalis caffra TaxID=77055 RepID=A0AAV1S0Z8_9ROSI|nr:unnamed protein product [Dovyalis caffra]
MAPPTTYIQQRSTCWYAALCILGNPVPGGKHNRLKSHQTGILSGEEGSVVGSWMEFIQEMDHFGASQPVTRDRNKSLGGKE